MYCGILEYIYIYIGYYYQLKTGDIPTYGFYNFAIPIRNTVL